MQKLVFVYNAEEGLKNSAIELFHKMVSPETYKCSLCKLTYGNFAMKQEWKKFLNELNIKIEFKYKNESEYEGVNIFPVIFVEEKGKNIILVNSEKLNRIKKIEELIELLKDQLALTNSQERIELNPQTL